MIEFKNVTKIYESGDKKVKAVDSINLHVEKGNIAVLLGPSGCGKTTLLRMVNRLIPVSGGIIEVNGKDINSLNPIELRRSIGYVIQQTGLFPNMTIEGNILVVPNLLGWDKVKMKKRYNELMEIMGLNPDDYRKRYPWELSGGQQQRIGVARALAADPPVMLMDEPFGALDPIIREHLQKEFLRIQQNLKKTVIFVSHDIDEAIRLGDSIAIFKEGKLMQYDSPDEILSNPKNEFVRDFVGDERILKRLSLLSVKELLKRNGKITEKSTDKSEIQKYSVQLDTNLRTALSFLLSSPTGEISVTDEKGFYINKLDMTDFEKLTGVHPSKFKSAVQ